MQEQLVYFMAFFQGGLVASPPKAKVAKVVQPESEESSSESSESEEEVIKSINNSNGAFSHPSPREKD